MFGPFPVPLALQELPFPEGRVHVSRRCHDSVTGSSVRDQHHAGRWWAGGPRGDDLFPSPHRFHADTAHPRGQPQWFPPAECVQATAGYQLCVRDSGSPPPPRPAPAAFLSRLPPPPRLSSSGIRTPLLLPWLLPSPLVPLQIGCSICPSLPLCCFFSVLLSTHCMLGLQDSEENAACSLHALQELNFKWVKQTGDSQLLHC